MMNRNAITIRVRRSAADMALICVLALGIASVAHAQGVSFTPFHPNGIYNLGEKVGWTVTLAPGGEATATQYNYVIKKDNLEVIQKGTLNLSSGSATHETTFNQPAMLRAEVPPVAGPRPAKMP